MRAGGERCNRSDELDDLATLASPANRQVVARRCPALVM
jgi:hypothetical protein